MPAAAPELEGRQVVDVREYEERESADPAFVESLHLPLTELRERMADAIVTLRDKLRKTSANRRGRDQ